ncbi:MAG TPA: hypothetical protein DCE18_08085 [Syntrophobacteraceae bacterium]|nr:hypothetical protein [Syntrophobacteraceae bacterium]
MIIPIDGSSYAHGNGLDIWGAKVIMWTEDIQDDESERRHKDLDPGPQADRLEDVGPMAYLAQRGDVPLFTPNVGETWTSMKVGDDKTDHAAMLSRRHAERQREKGTHNGRKKQEG